ARERAAARRRVVRVVALVGLVRLLRRRHRVEPDEAAGRLGTLRERPDTRRGEQAVAQSLVERATGRAAQDAARRRKRADFRHASLGAWPRARKNRTPASPMQRTAQASAAPSMPYAFTRTASNTR